MAPSSERCSLLTRSLGVDPVGTAGSFDVFVLLEHPLPWPRDLGDDPALAPLLAAAAADAGRRWRLQGLVPHGDGDGERRVIVYERPADGFHGYVRREATAPAGDVVELAGALAAGGGDVPRTDADDVQDVLICTHGRRDVCCGTLGTALWRDLDGRLHVLGPDVRLWRTSHTGGHRFAPTAITFPAGQYWSAVDARLIRHVVRRDGAVEDATTRYRGSAAMPSPAVQAAEREAFRREGWPWLTYVRSGRELSSTDGTVLARVEFTTPAGRSGGYDVEVVVRRVVPVPDCGKPLAEAKKSEAELAVVSVRSL